MLIYVNLKIKTENKKIMPTLKSPYQITKNLTSQYDAWASKIQKDPRNSQGVWFNTDSGSIYVRNMARGIVSNELVFCISSVNINKEYQGKGILSNFVKYIQKNPYSFKEVEIENICFDKLLNHFLNKGFKKAVVEELLVLSEGLPVTVVKKL